jgi:hypothetical protein
MTALSSTALSKHERKTTVTGVRVLNYRECAERADVSLRTWERMVADGTSPPVVHPSPGRRGHLDIDLEVWLEARRSGAAENTKVL